jgi:hypothetical protein
MSNVREDISIKASVVQDALPQAGAVKEAITAKMTQAQDLIPQVSEVKEAIAVKASVVVQDPPMTNTIAQSTQAAQFDRLQQTLLGQ